MNGEQKEVVVDISTTPYFEGTTVDISEKQENVRGRLAFGLLGLLIATVLAPFALITWGNCRDFEEIFKLIQIFLPAETALLGSALGFYFGTQAVNKTP